MSVYELEWLNCTERGKDMPQNTPDRRVQKTRKLLQEALIELVAEKGYESVTIQEILDQANVGRSTFYAHFQDKDQLLHSILDRLDELFEQHKEQLLDATKNSGSVNNTDRPLVLSPTLGLFRFVQQHHRFFKAMLGNRGYGIFAKPVYDHVFTHIHGIFTGSLHNDMLDHLHEPFKMMKAQEKYSSLESEIAAHYFVSALMGVLVWWVEKDMPCTAEEMDKLFRQLAVPGFQ
jgi:AcrR family transcriptional regulator